MTGRAALLAALLAAGPAFGQGLPNAIAPLPGATLPAPTIPSTPAPGGIVGPTPGITGMGSGENGMPAARGGIVGPTTGVYTGTNLAPMPGAALPFTCPKEHGGRRLASSDVYDGPPMTGNLVIQTGGAWHLKPQEWPGNAYYISCEYGVDRPPLGVRLPARIHECKRPLGSTTEVVCK